MLKIRAKAERRRQVFLFGETVENGTITNEKNNHFVDDLEILVVASIQTLKRGNKCGKRKSTG